MKIKLTAQLLDKFAIFDLVLSIGYIFFINFYSYIDASGLLMTAMSLIRLITVILFLIVLAISIISSGRKRNFVVTFGIVVLFIILCQVALFPENNDVFLETARNYVSTIFRIVVLFYVIDDFEKMVLWLRNYSCIIAAFLAVELFIRGISFNAGTYSMALGYICLFPAMVLIYNFKQKHQVIDLIAVIIIIITITLYASRGPLLCIALYIAMNVLRDSKSYITVTALIMIIAIYINFDTLLNILSNVAPNLGNSRTFLYILNSRMTEDSGRIGMYERVWNQFITHPFAIRGINSDYNVLGVYTHNIFLELLYEFGIVVGGGICVLIIIKVIMDTKKLNASPKDGWRFMFMLISIPQLLISHTLWSEWTFWVWIVLGIRSINFENLIIGSQKISVLNNDERFNV